MTGSLGNNQKGLEVCYCLWGCHPDPRLGPILGPSRSHPGSEVVPSRFAMCFVLQCFGPIQVPRWGPSRPVLVPSCSRAFLTGSGLDGQKQTSWPLPKQAGALRTHSDTQTHVTAYMDPNPRTVQKAAHVWKKMSGTSRRFPRHFLNCNFP